MKYHRHKLLWAVIALVMGYVMFELFSVLRQYVSIEFQGFELT